jgi:hypothetical protein
MDLSGVPGRSSSAGRGRRAVTSSTSGNNFFLIPSINRSIAAARQKQADNGRTVDGQFDDALRRCAMHRLMQALAAYGFLGLVKSHKHFLQYIPNALQSLPRDLGRRR